MHTILHKYMYKIIYKYMYTIALKSEAGPKKGLGSFFYQLSISAVKIWISASHACDNDIK